MTTLAEAPPFVAPPPPPHETSPFPRLTRIDAPDGALAAAQQMRSRTTVAYPRGFRDRGAPLATGRPTVAIPHKDSAMWFKQIHRGYRSANFLHTMQHSGDLLKHIVAEDAELAAFAASPAANAGDDNSLKPRALALWVEVKSPHGDGTTGDRILDAMAHWSTFNFGGTEPFAASMRLTVVGGADAAEYAGRVDAQHTRLDGNPSWAFRVSLRWIDASRQARTESLKFDHMPVSADAALVEVQSAAVRLAGTFDAPFPRTLVKPVTQSVRAHAFATAVIAVHGQFGALMTSTPFVKLDGIASKGSKGSGGAGPLENTGVVVRLCEKQLGASGVNHPSAFHGALLSFGRSRHQAVEYAKESAASSQGSLRMPIGHEEESLGLHTCAVQAQRTYLDRSITLFGTVGIAGRPIHSPRSWIWVECAAVHPVDLSLLDKFDVRPCAKWSVAPANTSLVEPFKLHFSLASQLFTSLDKHNQTTLVKSNTFSSFSSDDTEEALHSEPLIGAALDDEARTDERFMLSAFRVDLHSTRTTIGDAYSYLFDVGAPATVSKMLILAAGELGVGAPVSRMLTMCCDSMKRGAALTPLAEENDRLRAFASVALSALVTDAPAVSPRKRARSVSVESTERIRRLLHIVGLRRGSAAVVRRGDWGDREQNVTSRIIETLHVNDSKSVVATCELDPSIIEKADDEVRKGLTVVSDESEDAWGHRFEMAVARAAAVILVAAAATPTPPYYMISSVIGTDRLCIERLTTEPTPSMASIDAIVAETKPAVLILQRMSDYKFRITTTTVIDKTDKTDQLL